jgi:hypothetical protein
MKSTHEQDDVTVRTIPRARYAAIGSLVLALTVAATAVWEWRMRSLGLRAGDLDDGASHWTVERRRIEAGDHDGVVIFGSSRILFDTDLDAWEELTGRRPVQLALPGTNPGYLMKRFAEESDFGGLVVVGVTPGLYFSDFTSAFPAYRGLNELWREESPSRRFGHRVGLGLSRYLAFLDDAYRLGPLVERVDVPDRPGVRRPYHDVWKVSETFGDRQTVLWSRLVTDERLREHARQVWMARLVPAPAPKPAVVAQVIEDTREAVAKIRARGGEVVFVRAPSAEGFYASELEKVPRAATWDALLQETGAFGFHFEDYPETRDLEIPEMSHLTRESATRFTRIYVEALARELPWLKEPSSAQASP